MCRIGIDVDGVLAEHVPHLIKYLKRECDGLKLEKEDVSSWNINICGLDFKSLYEKYLRHKDFIYEIPVIEGAVEGVEKLSRRHRILIVTNRPSYSAEDTYIWLKNNGFEFHSLIVGSELDRVNLGIDILIDDNPYAIIKFARTGRESLLYYQPWNRKLFDMLDWNRDYRGLKIIKCRSWGDIIKIMDSG